MYRGDEMLIQLLMVDGDNNNKKLFLLYLKEKFKRPA